MADFCQGCFNKVFGTNFSEKDFILSDYLDLCEECEQHKIVVWNVKRWKHKLYNRFKLY